MKKSIIAAAALVALAACNKNVIEMTPAEAGYGYINLGITADTEMVVTKAEGDAQETPVYNDYYVTLEGGEIDWTKQFNAINVEDWKVPAGTYTISVYNVTAEDAYETESGMVRVSGETTVSVTAGIATSCTVACTPQNSKVSFMYTNDFDVVFDDPTVSVSNAANRTLNMIVGDSHLDTNAAYFEVETLNWSLNAELNGTTKNYTGTVTTQKAKWTQVTFTTGSTDGQINVTITVDGEITEVHTVTATIDPIGGTVDQIEGK